DAIVEGSLLAQDQAEQLEYLAKNFTSLDEAFNNGGQEIITTITNLQNDQQPEIEQESESASTAPVLEEGSPDQNTGVQTEGQTLVETVTTETESDQPALPEALENDDLSADQEAETLETLDKLSDFGEKIGGARKD